MGVLPDIFAHTSKEARNEKEEFYPEYGVAGENAGSVRCGPADDFPVLRHGSDAAV
jgi:hypothetical protein